MEWRYDSVLAVGGSLGMCCFEPIDTSIQVLQSVRFSRERPIPEIKVYYPILPSIL